MAKTYRLQWDRDVHGAARGSQRIRYRRGGAKWCEVASIEELPEDIRQAFENARSRRESLPQGPSDPDEVDSFRQTVRTKLRRGGRRRIARRRPTRAREIDRTLSLDHPWFDGFTLICVAIAAPYLGYTAWQELDDGGGMAVFAWLMLGLSAALTYFGLCVLVNSTDFQVDDEWLTVKHRPLPWFGARKVSVDRIVQLSTRMHRSRHSLTFSLSASLIGRSSVCLAEGINTYAEARSIERAIERHLGIEDLDE